MKFKIHHKPGDVDALFAVDETAVTIMISHDELHEHIAAVKKDKESSSIVELKFRKGLDTSEWMLQGDFEL